MNMSVYYYYFLVITAYQPIIELYSVNYVVVGEMRILTRKNAPETGQHFEITTLIDRVIYMFSLEMVIKCSI